MKKLKEVRIKKGITISELSEKSGVSERYLRFIEKGERNPSLKTANAIANALGVLLDTLVN